jgi:hypothetical protein
MKPESLGKLMEENAPEAAVQKKQKIEHNSAPDVGNAAAEERWMAVEKPDMSTSGEWIDVDVTTQPVSGGCALVDLHSDRKQSSHQAIVVGCSSQNTALKIAETLQKALTLQLTALSAGPITLKQKVQQRQVWGRLKDIEGAAHLWVNSIWVWKATAKEIEIEFKNFRDGEVSAEVSMSA